jgi:hypothetical protein
VASLLAGLRRADEAGQAAALASRAAAHAPLDDPYRVASLLAGLQEAGEAGQAAALLARDPAAHATLDNPYRVAILLESLRRAGAQEQAAALASRLPGVGMFGLFLEQQEQADRDRFWFGQKADGSPSGRWGWDDLD